MNESCSIDSKHGKSMPLRLARAAQLVLRAPVGTAELVFRTAVRAAGPSPHGAQLAGVTIPYSWILR
jgi:hypothetical protein